MGELLNTFLNYASKNKRMRGIDKWVYVQLAKAFIDFLNDSGYIITYVGKKHVRRQVFNTPSQGRDTEEV